MPWYPKHGTDEHLVSSRELGPTLSSISDKSDLEHTPDAMVSAILDEKPHRLVVVPLANLSGTNV
jgi:hypothetical protein